MDHQQYQSSQKIASFSTYGAQDLSRRIGQLWYVMFNGFASMLTLFPCRFEFKENEVYLVLDQRDFCKVSFSLSLLHRYSRAARGVKNLWATKVSGPQKAMHFQKVHYLCLITWGAVYPEAWAYSV